MPYLSTQLATDFSSQEVDGSPYVLRIVERALDKCDSNPNYNLSAVDEWWIEFDDAGQPQREIGLDHEGETILAGPDDDNYGFWHDTNMKYTDFDGVEIGAEKFESRWTEWFSSR